MVARINTVSFQGIEPLAIDVQVQITTGIPSFSIVGLPDKAVAESRERVRAALHSLGLALPPKRIIVNLSPADIQKEGSHYDLPIALGLLVALEVLPFEEVHQYVALGELALDGRISSISGVLPAALHASSQGQGLICPEPCGKEAAWAPEIDILAPSTLLALINHFKGLQLLPRPSPGVTENSHHAFDLIDVKGQETAKRAFEIAAAGGHNLLLMGPPGAGKSMLAARLPGLLPPLEPEEALEVTMIHSIAGKLPEGTLIKQRPYRDPHHSASLPALVGGGFKALPGEVTLAHRGVLFLDELPEFSRSTLESLRQPLETGQVTIARANAHITYPARFQLIAAMNPCRCGYLDEVSKACSRAPKCAVDYQAKISGPLLDRIDFHVFTPAVKPLELALLSGKESTETVAERVAKARLWQRQRFLKKIPNSSSRVNAEASGKELEAILQIEEESQGLLNQAAEKLRFSARSYHRLLRVARTIADLGESETIRKIDMAEALSLRLNSLTT
ncbi:MAG: YifB family Mg chelatase-like AAA ATPase [Candidatus Paracaedimonas acanthamoebae]|uniref:YifB family Mg chelatase-like AAA ATPase n=1 Tax=Candidatus Paracaedimonas acanthamoebae TaxID=244581 RepID=A0A8J7PZN1_9PROT|nr:YifB family Mg chelatase-like AAA ATPase [Candidatus Paracaedimonas acanthamoebae]